MSSWSRGLLARFRGGETQALDEVYRAYADSVARTVAAVLRRHGEAMGGWAAVATELPDLVQEVFTRAFAPHTRLSFDGLRDYGPFLAQIARNVTIDHLRRRNSHVTADVERLFENVHAQAAGPDLSDAFAEAETMNVVARYLAALSPELQRAHEVLYVRGLSEREAAAALGVGRQVVRTLGERLRAGLRQLLAEEGRSEAKEHAQPKQHSLRSGSG